MAVFVQFLGQVGCGKSYLAKELATLKGGVVLPFAKEVYRLAHIVKGAHIDKSRVEDRELLMLIGTAWGRQSQRVPQDIQEILERHKPRQWGTPDIWARIFISNCRQLPPNTSIFNDDTRFLNELEIAIAEMGFIPVFVACSDETRRNRLQSRGDGYDPSATDHLSEEMANLLRGRVLSDSIMPVVWNDCDTPKPQAPWVHGQTSFQIAVDNSRSNAELAAKLHWTPERAECLVATIRESLGQPQGEIYA